MARRRGFLAELQRASKQAEMARKRQQAALYRAQVTAQREAERAQRAAERAAWAAKVADHQEHLRLAREAARLHAEAQEAEAEARNASLEQVFKDIDGILEATLSVDDYVDLEALKVRKVKHPPFDPGELATPTPPMPELVYPEAPAYQGPTSSPGLFNKRRHAEQVAQAQAEHAKAVEDWHAHNTALYNDHLAEMQRRQAQETARLGKLADARAQYESECRQREQDAETGNQSIDKLINDLAFDVEPAIHEYVDIVLSNSVYPEALSVSHEHEFDLASRELKLAVMLPPPAAISNVKSYKYVKARDEIVPTLLPLKTQKDRYANAVWQVAVRSLHEVFEADRSGKIHSIALTVRTETISPATGLPQTVPLVIVSVDRETFAQFDLGNVVPRATLDHLGAAVSKVPFDLVPADTSRGVRARKQ